MKHRTRLAADMQVSCMILEKKSMALRKHLVTRSLTTRASSGTQLSDTSRLSATQAPFIARTLSTELSDQQVLARVTVLQPTASDNPESCPPFSTRPRILAFILSCIRSCSCAPTCTYSSTCTSLFHNHEPLCTFAACGQIYIISLSGGPLALAR